MKGRRKRLWIERDEHRWIVSQGSDVPEQPPAFCLPIDKVGIESNLVWVNLPQGRLPFDASISFSLPGSYRGIHMSRIEEALTSTFRRSFSSLKEYARALAADALKAQRGRRVYITLSGEIPLVRTTQVSRRESVESLKVFLDLTWSQTEAPAPDEIEEKLVLGIEVEHMTACPCTQAYHQAYLDGMDSNKLPLPTHSQRTITRLYIEDRLDMLGFTDLLLPADRALHLIQGLLKRPDEAELVLSAHKQPHFVEDVVRELAAAAADELAGKVHSDALMRIQSVSIESIHTHNVAARLEMSFGEIAKRLDKTQKATAS